MQRPNFPHLLLVQKGQGLAQLEGGGAQPERVTANLEDRAGHANMVAEKIAGVAGRGERRDQERQDANQPPITGGTPFLLQIPAEDDRTMDYLAEKLGLEIVAEYDNGYLIVATQDLDVSVILAAANGFAESERGTGGLARILEIDDDPSSEGRIKRILGEELWPLWPFPDNSQLILDVSIETAVFGTPVKPNLSRIKKPELLKLREDEYADALRRHQAHWDEKRFGREEEIEVFVSHYGGAILSIVDDSHVVEFPDSFSVRLQMSGLGFKDLILNYPSMFEVVIPDDIDSPIVGIPGAEAADAFELSEPSEAAPTVCVIDSGIQEGHRWIGAAIRPGLSQCFVPGTTVDDVADYVEGGGHGTRVAGAALYPSEVPKAGTHEAPFWIANARVLDRDCKLVSSVYPPELLRKVVGFYVGEGVRVFNHSIGSNCCCRTSRMSAWATAIDDLSFREDALVVQAAGNLSWRTGVASRPGVLDHLDSRTLYPHYLYNGSSRIANPAQSLQALTVGSVAGEVFEDEDRLSLAFNQGPSSFSRTGLGLWDSIKPEVVEFGGDDAVSKFAPFRLTSPPAICPELLRSTLGGGPAYDRDATGTSFAAPKVTHIAGQLQSMFPERSTQLYRALIVNSARWPSWAETKPVEQRVKFIRSIGYGVPSLERATENAPSRITLITDSEFAIRAKEGFVFGVPVPEELRRPGDDFVVRIDITLAYVAEPRRTRKGRRGYLSVWLDWKASRCQEPFDTFVARALKDANEAEDETAGGGNFPWNLGNSRERDGVTDGVSRKNGTVQKDWAITNSFELPDVFGIVVRGHEGWARRNPESTAKFSLVVSFEVVGAEVPIYEAVRNAIEAEVAEIEVQAP